MKKIVLAVVLSLTALAASAQIRHYVTAGETLSSIARKYGVTVEQIKSWNTPENLALYNKGTHVLTIYPANRTTSSTSSGTVSGGSQHASFFPVFGMTLGETTRAEAAKMGYCSTSKNYPECYDVGTWDFWDHDKDGVFEQLYLTYTDEFPQQWLDIGCSWALSYNQWQALFRRLGYTVTVTESPKTKPYGGRNTLSAKFTATDPSTGLQFRLDFNYGNDHGEGYTVDSQKTLYSITAAATRGSVRNAGGSSSGADSRSTASAATSGECAAFFPVLGLTLGETTVSEAKSMGCTNSNPKYPNQYYLKYDGTKKYIITDSDKDGILDKMLVSSTDDMPVAWSQQGFDWSLSYNQWQALLRRLGFAINVTESPRTEVFSGRNTLKARFKATHPSNGLVFDLEFEYNNRNGEGYSVTSKNTVRWIFARATRGSSSAQSASYAGGSAAGASVAKTAVAEQPREPVLTAVAASSEGLRPVTQSTSPTVCCFADDYDNIIMSGKSFYLPKSYETDNARALYNFRNGVAVVAERENKWGVIDQSGNTVIPFEYRVNSYCGFYENEYFVFLGGFGSPGNGYKTFYVLDMAGDVLFECKNTYDSKPIAKIKAFYDKKGKAIIAANRRAGKYEAVTGRITAAVQSTARQSEQLRLAQAAEAERQRLLREERERLENSFMAYARHYVEEKINKWQIKGEYEKTSDWRRRVNETTRRNKVRELTREAEENFIAERSRDIAADYSIDGSYDADNETYCINSERFGKLLVRVPVSYAKQFRDQWPSIRKTPTYFIDGDRLALAGVSFRMKDNREFRYSNQASLNYSTTQVEYNFNPIELEAADAPTVAGRQNISTTKLTVGNRADIDMTVPQNATDNTSTFAVIIANENYANAGDVEFALNDGRSFGEYCRKTLGIPEKNINIYDNATFVGIRSALNLLGKLVDTYGEKSNVIFYYAGHGIPDEKSSDSYLLPVDGIPSDMSTCYSLDGIYRRLGEMKAERVVVFMDACFSGSQRNGEIIAAARGVAVKAKSAQPYGNMVVFSAAQGDETAYPYKEKSHGLFTYYLLKKLQHTRGEATLGELSDFVTKNVKMESLQTNKRSQTPCIRVSSVLGDGWRNMKLK